MSYHEIEDLFPALKSSYRKITSPKDSKYNCISWAANLKERGWLWPEGGDDWLTDSEEVTILAFLKAFEILGYAECKDGSLEPGYEKVALYADPFTLEPKHMARQLDNGIWTSKLGNLEDIEHEKLEAIEGDVYGKVIKFMKRSKR